MVAFFFGEVRIHPLGAKPGFFFSPAQAFLQQDLAHAAALDRDLLVLVQVGGQPVQAPTAKGQLEFLGPVQRGGHHFGAFLGGVGRGSARARGVCQGVQAAGVKASQPLVNGAPVKLQLGGDGTGGLALQATPHDRGPFHQARFGLAAVSQFLNVGTLGSVHFTQRKHLPKSRGLHPGI